MNYELWSDDAGYSFFGEDNESARRLLKADARLIWTVEASTWEDARTKQHEFLGWEPYKLMNGDDSPPPDLPESSDKT